MRNPARIMYSLGTAARPSGSYTTTVGKRKETGDCERRHIEWRRISDKRILTFYFYEIGVDIGHETTKNRNRIKRRYYPTTAG